MAKFSHVCEPLIRSPFTFWATRPVGDSGSVGCQTCESGNVDWTRADADEVHGSDRPDGERVGSRGAFSTRDYVRSLAINMLLSDASATGTEACIDFATRRGWWADDWREDGFRLGSRLWTLSWSTTVSETLTRARQYAEEALQWLVRFKVAKEVRVKASYVGNGRLLLEVNIIGPWQPIGLFIEGTEHAPYGFLWREVSDGQM